MHARTRNTLIGLGFDTVLIDAIARNNHTLDLTDASSASLN
jgi:hypothetical protein